MATWTANDLNRIGASDELDLASRRADGSLSGFVTMWVVRAGDDLFVRSAGGPNRPWYRNASAVGRGVIRAGRVEHDVAFTDAGSDVFERVDAAYHVKYYRYGPTIVGSVVGPAAHQVTIRLIPTNGAE